MDNKDKIDIVVLFVDMNDKEWRNRYEEYVKTHEIPIPEINNVEVRSRDYGTLKCLLRSIDKNLPWVNKVHLCVQSYSQVPKWVNTNTVNIVLHEEFIPEKFLPTYNAFTIQAHVHRIPNLQEKFIYLDDDSIFTQYTIPEKFFINDKIVQPIRKLNINSIMGSSSKFSHYFKKSASDVAKIACNIQNDLYYMDEHGARGMFKSLASKLYDSININKHVSPFRNYGNIFMNTYTTYAWLNRRIINVPGRSAYIDFKNKDINQFRKWLNNNQFKDQLSINDQDLNPEFDKELFYAMVEKTLLQLFPEKSKKYEI